MEEFDTLQYPLLKIKDIRGQLKSIDRTMEEEDMVVISFEKFSFSCSNFIKA
jgi:hypothetical protein